MKLNFDDRLFLSFSHNKISCWVKNQILPDITRTWSSSLDAGNFRIFTIFCSMKMWFSLFVCIFFLLFSLETSRPSLTLVDFSSRYFFFSIFFILLFSQVTTPTEDFDFEFYWTRLINATMIFFHFNFSSSSPILPQSCDSPREKMASSHVSIYTWNICD
jgi:hypothetical protein